jgi:DNA mismatch repair protein MLH3
LEQKHDCGRADGSVQDFGLGGLQLSQSDLRNAKVVAQIDDKFICCAISSNVDPRTTVLVLVDQHAADERVRVERFLGETLREFEKGGVTATSLEGDAHVVQLSKEQRAFLVNHPETSQLLERWGFCVSSKQPPTSTDNANLSVNSVPTLLLSRLGAKGAKDVNKVISGYIAFLQTQPIGAITSLVNTSHDPAQTGLDTTGLLRWMPRRMKELVDSKACRGECSRCPFTFSILMLWSNSGAIMFNDPLTMDKCDFLIQQLGQTSFPFICAHGRPSIFPLVRLAQPNTGRGEQVDWEKQFILHQE